MNNIFQMIQSIKNPNELMNNIVNDNQIMKNPIINNAVQMFQKGDTEGLNKLAENICKENGTSMEEMKKQLMKRFGL